MLIAPGGGLSPARRFERMLIVAAALAIASRVLGTLTPDTALRLARYLRTTPDFWLGLQAQYDIGTAQDGMSAEIAAIKPRKVA